MSKRYTTADWEIRLAKESCAMKNKAKLYEAGAGDYLTVTESTGITTNTLHFGLSVINYFMLQ